ncbi:EAL domain-containing protein [Erythrobacter sp. SCSIO 43205]|nr:EAL domain-containing protein [Erythrobacter sp. SCSIO 43205]
MRLTSRGLIILPLAIISIVVAGISAVLVAAGALTLAAPSLPIILSAFAFAASIIGVCRMGLTNMKELELLERTDRLTHLPNRHALHEDIQASLDTNEEVAIALLDLDGFKQINDHFGHTFGDALITQCAQLFEGILGDEAVCYRLGGDEFAAVTTGPMCGTILEGLCRRLLDRLNAPVLVGTRELAIGASVGITHRTKSDDVSPSELLRRSDVAMYMSKRGGKMRCTWFNESFDQHREAIRQLEDDLREGLKKRQFSLVYQPLVEADSERIVGVEALLRWNRDDGGEARPDHFIPVAEESGIINPLGLWVLREAMTKALKWGDISLSVNISAAQLRNSDFPIKLGEILEETGYPPEQLELEVTETCLVLDPAVAERSLNVIREFGCRISLDDFGTGYASIGFLRQFRFEKLKIDRTLVIEASQDESFSAMMISSIAIARALNMAVTAEGVETSEQADLARLAGCDQIQGWLFHKPHPASEIDKLIARQEEAHWTAQNDRQLDHRRIA